ncbi:DEAD/DEAH box helicase [Sodalis sp. dw_96]|uniref:DEAD/DEAH box helicase n=1 Tax=Sodalis sp. dw_96 TaxID=2719794 RepID=UPI001BD64681|nr:DEAD/DEAH box helicase [Sodalis sp. dw_96]
MDDKHNNDALLSSTIDGALQVLDYWHKIEFFESTDIKDLEDGAEGVLRYTAEQLQQPACLPWIDPEQIRRAGKNYLPSKKYNYKLYFGIFDRNEIFDRAKRAYPELANDKQEQNQDEGRTCSITLFVDQDGHADGESFEFSTVTWALGQLEKSGLENISLDNYEVETENVRQRFLEVMMVAGNLKQQHGLQPVLTGYEIIEFLKSMAAWTDFIPEISTPALYVKLTEAKPKVKGQLQEKIELKLDSLYHLSRLPEIITKKEFHKLNTEKPITAKNEITEPYENNKITILNSFYIRDIERVIKDIKKEGIDLCSPLGRYLCGEGEKQPDLLAPEGKPILIKMLRLSKLPAGRWPAETAHGMSLMQQFAINNIEEELAHCGLYSVNGPPGTGKTTMLRDLIAGNLVKRAGVLAGLDNASDAFSGEITITLGNKLYNVKCLSPMLTGFEMVVVSSNNAAVENISQELPQLKSLGKSWEGINYLKPVAQKLAAVDRPLKEHEHSEEKAEGKKRKIEPLTKETECWGLIAAALGKQENRDIFGGRVFYHTMKDCFATPPADDYATLADAIKDKNLAVPSFSDAKSAFIKAKTEYQERLKELSKLETLAEHEGQCWLQKRKSEQKHARLLRLDARLAKRRENKPAWRFINIRQWCRAHSIIKGLNLRQNTAEAQYKIEFNKWELLHSAWIDEQRSCAALKEKYAGVIFPTWETDLEAAAIQRTAFGQCPILNEARTHLMVKALDLHQAWLATAYKESYLSQSIFALMHAINGVVADPKAAKALWHLLFMIVPVISSTFASVARQFAALGSGDIGWLFIDEAGQATPQQAAGALWRAKRAVVVGDPLQIEPVFTVPPTFVEAIARREFGKQWLLWSPTVQSVQNLADRANPYGTYQIAKGTWLGSPLRVHRRCDEPMFSIANAIAYNNKMLHGRDDIVSDENFIWGPSCWFDVRGKTEGKHFVPAQARHVLHLLQAYIDRYQKLPDAYIITPFKQVKNRLRHFLKEELTGVDGGDKWLRDRIGTVHTFQGKEEKNVIFVLGLSDESRGAAKWASSKPNLLNVAVTRAQKRIYIIGDPDIWSSCNYFNVAYALLSRLPSLVATQEAEVPVGV